MSWQRHRPSRPRGRPQLAPLTDRFLDQLGERVAERANTEAVFGAPIVRNGLTVVPVARVRWGYGGGAGSTSETDAAGRPAGSGSGGGGGVAADPLGYLEIRSEGATFRPIAQLPSPFFVLACGITAGIVLRALGRLARPSAPEGPK